MLYIEQGFVYCLEIRPESQFPAENLDTLLAIEIQVLHNDKI